MTSKSYFRRHPRIQLALSATLQGEGTQFRTPVQVLDLSLVGAGVAMRDALAPGSRVLMDISAPTLWDPLPLHGQVRWSAEVKDGKWGHRAGIRFDHRGQEHLAALFDLLGSQRYE